jgi:cytochrome c oxidase subunit 2
VRVRAVAVAALLAGSWWLAVEGAGVASAAVTVPAREPGPEPSAVHRIELLASRYVFEPSLIEVRVGETVEIVARSKDTDHGLAIEAFGVKLRIPKGGAPVSVRFVPSRAGRYPFACSEYCGSGHKRMKGVLVVDEATP